MTEPGLYSLTLLVTGLLSALSTGPAGTVDLPPDGLSAAWASQTTMTVAADVRDRDGRHLGTARIPTNASDDYPEHFLAAVLAAEDKRFALHPGIDPVATVQALAGAATGELRGASTLTQQAVKNTVSGSERSLRRKVQEAILATRLERYADKRDILDIYLSSAWFGRGVTGANDAPHAWFGKSLAEVDLAEAAFLAGILKGPANYEPPHTERALARRNYVLDRMLHNGWIEASAHAAAVQQPLTILDRVAPRVGSDAFTWPLAAARRELSERFTREDPLSSSSAVRVTTTMSAQWQAILERELRKAISAHASFGSAGRISSSLLDQLTEAERRGLSNHLNAELTVAAAAFLPPASDRARVVLSTKHPDGSWTAWQEHQPGRFEKLRIQEGTFGPTLAPVAGDVFSFDRDLRVHPTPDLQGAGVVLHAPTGAILAIAGGYDARISRFDRSQAARQPGSAIKSFLYLAALQAGYAADHPILDAPIEIQLPDGQLWSPRNYDDSSGTGYIPLFLALEESSNRAAVRLATLVGLADFTETAFSSGAYQKPIPDTPAAVLGAAETTVLALASGYAAIANGGVPVRPHLIGTVTPKGSKDPAWARPLPSADAIFPDSAVSDLQAMLRGAVVRGTASTAFTNSSVPVAGKTGTSQRHRDAWFVGFTPDLVVAVWIGRDDNAPTERLTGGVIAAPAAAAVFEAAFEANLIDQTGFVPSTDALTPKTTWPPQVLLQRTADPVDSLIVPMAPPGPPSDFFNETDRNRDLRPGRFLDDGVEIRSPW